MGAAVTVGCVVPLVQGVLSLSWPRVNGVITHSRDKAGYRVIGVDIGYRYATGGDTYTGSRFRFQFVLTARHMWGRDVRSILGRYRVGEPVRIAVNPGKPADSVLEPGPDFDNMIPFVLGLFLLLLGLGDVAKHEPVQGSPPWPLPARPRYGLAKILAAAGVALFLPGAFYLYHGIRSMNGPPSRAGSSTPMPGGGASPETLLWYEYYVDHRRYLASTYRNGGNATFVEGADATRRPPGARPKADGDCVTTLS